MFLKIDFRNRNLIHRAPDVCYIDALTYSLVLAGNPGRCASQFGLSLLYQRSLDFPLNLESSKILIVLHQICKRSDAVICSHDQVLISVSPQ